MKKLIFLGMIVLISVGASGCCWPWGCRGDGGGHGGGHGGGRDWHHDR